MKISKICAVLVNLFIGRNIIMHNVQPILSIVLDVNTTPEKLEPLLKIIEAEHFNCTVCFPPETVFMNEQGLAITKMLEGSGHEIGFSFKSENLGSMDAAMATMNTVSNQFITTALVSSPNGGIGNLAKKFTSIIYSDQGVNFAIANLVALHARSDLTSNEKLFRSKSWTIFVVDCSAQSAEELLTKIISLVKKQDPASIYLLPISSAIGRAAHVIPSDS
jgi:hypothetical protein